MNKKALVAILPLSMLLTFGNNSDAFDKPKSNIKKASISKKKISSSYLDETLKTHYHKAIVLTNTHGFTFTRYVLLDTAKTGDLHFLNLAINHNASLSNTVLTLDSFSLVGMMETAGFGITTEAEAPGVYCSFSAEMNLSTSKDVMVNYGASYELTKERDPSGTYYVYLEDMLYDSIVVKKSGENFVSAEYYYNTPYNDFLMNVLSIRLLKTRPNTSIPVLPIC